MEELRLLAKWHRAASDYVAGFLAAVGPLKTRIGSTSLLPKRMADDTICRKEG